MIKNMNETCFSTNLNAFPLSLHAIMHPGRDATALAPRERSERGGMIETKKRAAVAAKQNKLSIIVVNLKGV